jgi:hypothetical protein
MLFGTTHEFLLSGRAEKVTAHRPGVNNRLQWQSREQFRRVFWTGGSAKVARSAKKTRDVWRDTPSGAMVHSSDSEIAMPSWVSTPSRARHPCPAGCKLLISPHMSPRSDELPCDVESDMRLFKAMPRGRADRTRYVRYNLYVRV